MECLWRNVVLSKDSTTKRSSEQRYVPSFTVDQQSQFLKGFDELIATFANGRTDVVHILQGYRMDIANNLLLLARTYLELHKRMREQLIRRVYLDWKFLEEPAK
jgi:hypothetical protein